MQKLLITVQLLSVFVLVFGDIGFDRPGRYGLSFGHLLLFIAVLVSAMIGSILLAFERRTGNS